MDALKRPIHADLLAAARKVIKAHDAVQLGIASHAERHAAALHARRLALAQQGAIADGIRRHAGQV